MTECDHEVPVFGCESCITKSKPEDIIDLEHEDEWENEDE